MLGVNVEYLAFNERNKCEIWFNPLIEKEDANILKGLLGGRGFDASIASGGSESGSFMVELMEVCVEDFALDEVHRILFDFFKPQYQGYVETPILSVTGKMRSVLECTITLEVQCQPESVCLDNLREAVLPPYGDIPIHIIGDECQKLSPWPIHKMQIMLSEKEFLQEPLKAELKDMLEASGIYYGGDEIEFCLQL